MNKLFKALSFSAIALCLSVSSTFAAGNESNCQIVYGGGEVCNPSVKFTLNKTVQTPGKGGGDFVDNLTINDSRFVAGQNISFKINITNTGNSTVNNIRVVDTFPQFLSFVAGAGSFDSNNKTLSFTIDKLDAGKGQDVIITAKVVNDSDLPTNSGITCVTNVAKATDSTGNTAEDSSQVCIQRNVTVVTPTPQIFEKVTTKQIPATGPEMLPLIGLIPAGLTGFYLRRKSNQ
ncbi:MAG: hypothetical protein COX79_03730 [Candidatus Levybacteria bacterium CG_4_10_14_0_2_um_filter_36_16]|nr:MAG: hypothetical protein AUK12_01885 [Candidatus Levybacteria bacterium CG2_30_37_29]PIR79190.1 MAG: hypothetical protein COU26_02445 [Candidatus Levybacteria bacterium CG10_big_fil_rev_8_21_14_0_10_36_30]PIZ97035.1 MAG: hypothetical protein COX79_03730 [Candidatus Levybacteria bacterium CG_4_10_14_0_2_um_filter_36_16]PJA90152.1 MAG: hypothetical protein CO136_03035 [Candidatus Levybacteria bacterium CG_4_9_14_3_um_filter_36_7]